MPCRSKALLTKSYGGLGEVEGGGLSSVESLAGKGGQAARLFHVDPPDPEQAREGIPDERH